jgi:hypothetical protein
MWTFSLPLFSLGAAVFGILFRQLSYETAFLCMGLAAAFSGVFSLFIVIEGQSTLLRGDKSSGSDGDATEGVALKKADADVDEEKATRKRKSTRMVS